MWHTGHCRGELWGRRCRLQHHVTLVKHLWNAACESRLPFRNFVIQSWTAASLWTLEDKSMILNHHWISSVFSTCQTGRRFQAKHALQLFAGREKESQIDPNLFWEHEEYCLCSSWSFTKPDVCCSKTYAIKSMCAFVWMLIFSLNTSKFDGVTGWNMQPMPAG